MSSGDPLRRSKRRLKERTGCDEIDRYCISARTDDYLKVKWALEVVRRWKEYSRLSTPASQMIYPAPPKEGKKRGHDVTGGRR